MIDFNLIPVLPEIFLSLIGMGLLIVGASQGNVSTRVICWSATCGLVLSALILLSVGWETRSVLGGMFVMDKFAGFMKLMIIIGLVASLALSVRYLLQEGMERFEFPILVLFAGIGMMIMVSSNNFLALYMGLELQSLSLYVLAAFHRNSMRSSEAGIKYFLLGALSSGMLLFGISLVYGFTGSVDFEVVGTTLSDLDGMPIGVTFGLVFILAGLAFKVSAVPFHMWTPDVYEGAPTAVTALFAIVPKIAAMGLLMRLLFEPFMALSEQWVQIIYFLALMSMFLGAFAGIAQDNIKRLLAYSSIGNMGYALIGVVAGSAVGAGAVVLYLFIYMIMSAGVFAVVMCMRRRGMAVYKISDLAGLSRHAPGLAYAMAILMFSMSGIPPAAGFFGKLVVFNAAVAEGYYILATLGVLTSVVAAYYYLRVIKVMFFDEPADVFDGPIPFARRVVLFICILFVLGFVIKPSVFIASSFNAASVLFAG
ncbi:MAG: NADH-quinone oxidoreductase subunit NuoN [Rhodospirillales bacterium]|nr:NADH-quinone oxidoreductase subunit NuoN [Alphaproteobacteria bacterium]MCB9980855.1 NADH-quinone oxidoreductase subunit NuoN [Rhodospirillales bacterium]